MGSNKEMKAINPFHAGTYDGVTTYYTDAESRIDRVRMFTREQCEAALKTEGLQKTVQAAVCRRLRQIADVALPDVQPVIIGDQP